jgi:hypothetical protein
VYAGSTHKAVAMHPIEQLLACITPSGHSIAVMNLASHGNVWEKALEPNARVLSITYNTDGYASARLCVCVCVCVLKTCEVLGCVGADTVVLGLLFAEARSSRQHPSTSC